MKLSAAYNFPFSITSKIPLALWESCTKHDSFNGFYILLDDINNVDLTAVYTPLTNRVFSWYDLSGSTNYLYSYNTAYPTLVRDPLFNNNLVLDFPDGGTTQMLFKTTQTIGTIIFVYLNRTTNGHLILAPRTVPNTSPTVYYDMFPKTTNILWTASSYSNDFARNSVSRVNGKQVSPDYVTSFNTPRILTVKDFPTDTVTIQGIGGRQGGPAFAGQNVDSVEGKIAAIITFSENLSDEDVLEIELELQKLYITYTGPALSTVPSFNYLVGQSFSYDFSSIAIDEWFSIVDYELLSPLDLGLSFTSGVLSGTLSKYYEGNLSIRITNEAARFNTFSIPVRVLRQDPLVSAASYSNEIQLALTSDTAIDNSSYGYYADRWESGLRSQSKSLANAGNIYPVLVEGLYYNSVRFYDSNTSLSISSQTAKTFLWVYIQESYGNRYMLSGLPDIKGTGELWTVANNTQVHGTTDVTSMITYVNKQPVDTLSYKLDLNKLYFITAKSTVGIPFTGLSSLRGKLLYFICWSNELSQVELSSYIATLASRYYTSLKPYQTSTSTVYNYLTSFDLDLNDYVVDFFNNTLTYSYNGSIPSNVSLVDNILTIANTTDITETFSLIADNSLDTEVITLTVDTILLNNVLYRALKLLHLFIDNIFLTEVSTISSNDWTAYRGDSVLEGTTLTLENIYAKDYMLLAYVNNDLLLPSTPISGKTLTFYIVIDPFASGSFDLFQINGSDADFGDISNNLIATNTNTLIKQAALYINGKSYTNYILKKGVPYIVSFVFNQSVSITALKNAKGYLGLFFTHSNTDTKITETSAAIHSYFNPTKQVLALAFNNSINDTALQANITHTSYFSTTRQEGTHSCHLLNNKTSSYIVVPNNTNFIFNNFGYRITFYIAVNQTFVNSTDKFLLLTIDNLSVYLINSGLVVGRSTITTPLASTPLTYSSSVFTKITIQSVNNKLELLKNDVVVASGIADNYMYDDGVTSLTIGQNSAISANLVTNNTSILFDLLTVESL